MRKINRQQFEDMKREGYIFTTHNLYQNEKTAVLVTLVNGQNRPMQFRKIIKGE